MWKPSVKAIWLRAASRSAASGRRSAPTRSLPRAGDARSTLASSPSIRALWRSPKRAPIHLISTSRRAARLAAEVVEVHAEVGERTAGRPQSSSAADLADRPARGRRPRARPCRGSWNGRARPGPARRGSPWPRGGPAGSPPSRARAAACRAGPSRAATSPITEISGCPGTVRSGLTSMRPAAVGARRRLRGRARR